MAVGNDGFHTLSVAEAYALPENAFRALFVKCVIELTGAFGELFTQRIDFLGRRLEQLSTREMQEIVLRHQEWFSHRPKAAA